MKTKYIVLTAILIFASFYSVAHAQTVEPTAASSVTETPNPSSTPRFGFFGLGRGDKNETPEPSETPRVRGEDRLERHRLTFCQNHEDEIKEKLGNLGDFVSRALGTFDAIASRVENFYTTKVAPTHPISNYQALVSDIAAKRAAAVTALTNAQSDINGFVCTGANPKGQITQYRVDMQLVKQALKDYRTSIKNLIVAVKAEVEGSESPEPSGSPTATATPVATATPLPTSSPTATP